MAVLPDKKKTRLAIISGLATSALGATAINIKAAIDKLKKEEDINKSRKLLRKIETANIPDETKERLREYVMSFLRKDK